MALAQLDVGESMKWIFITIFIGSILGCQSGHKEIKPSISRSSNVEKLDDFYTCGRIDMPESFTTGHETEDFNYSLKLDCNHDKKLSKKDGGKTLLIPSYTINKASKEWLSHLKHSLVSSTKNPKAKPYVCLRAKIENDPCHAQKSLLGFSPIFSKVK